MFEILKAFLKVTAGTMTNLVLGSISLKILASVLGPEGLGLFSFLRQIQLTALLTAVGGQNALVQGGAAREGQERQTYLQTVLLFSVLSGFAVAVGIFLFAPLIAEHVIGQTDTATIWAVRLVALPIFFCTLTGYANGIQNVYRELGQMAVAQMVGAVAAVLFVYPAAVFVKQGHKELLPVWMLTLQTGSLITSLLFLWRRGHLAQILAGLAAGYKQAALRYFLKFAGVTTINTLLANLAVLVIRTLIENHQGLATVGIFEAAWTLSMTYASLLAMAFGAYYLPTLTALQAPEDRTALLQRMFHFATLMATPLVVGVVVLKPLAIQLLFSNEFLPALSLLRWMLIGDYFKITSWVFAYTMVASADTRIMFWSELVWNGCLLLGSIYSLFSFSSVEGIGIIFSLSYFGYFLFTIGYAKTKFKLKLQKQLVFTWCGGLAIIILSSWQNWQVSALSKFGIPMAWGIVVLLYLLIALGRQARRNVYSYLVKA